MFPTLSLSVCLSLSLFVIHLLPTSFPQFTHCSFTVADEVPYFDKSFLKKIISFGFAVKDVDPLVIEKGSTSADNIEALIKLLKDVNKQQVKEASGKEECGEKKTSESSIDQQQLQHGQFFNTCSKMTDSLKTKSGIRVNVKNTDITKLAVDAIVNAANSRLNHVGSVAKAISNKAGAELQKECYKFTKGERKIPVAGIFVSTAGNLPSKHVIHAVGPRWRDYEETKKEECARDLRRTVLRCLVEANQRGCRSIAIPSISAGELLQDYI